MLASKHQLGCFEGWVFLEMVGEVMTNDQFGEKVSKTRGCASHPHPSTMVFDTFHWTNSATPRPSASPVRRSRYPESRVCARMCFGDSGRLEFRGWKRRFRGSPETGAETFRYINIYIYIYPQKNNLQYIQIYIYIYIYSDSIYPKMN